MGLKEAILGMSTQQKVATVVVACLIPVVGWLTVGAATSFAVLVSAKVLLPFVAAEVTAVITSVEAIFGVSPPVPPIPS
jgi:hypothetical protein